MDPQSRSVRRPEGKPQKRLLATSAAPVVDLKKRTATMSFSSEEPVQRWFGSEVLSHARGAADLSRLNNGGPLLFNHDMDDVLGVVESASIAPDGKGRAVVRFGSDERGEWALQQVADGILTNVSFLYTVDKYDKTDDENWIGTRWMAYEISIVTVPADPSVGIGRSHSHQPKGRTNMEDDIDNGDAVRQSRGQSRAMARGVEAERERIVSLQALARNYNLDNLAKGWIDDGATIDQARAEVLERNMGRQRPVTTPMSENQLLGLKEHEVEKFSLVRAINACINKDWSEAGFERECTRAVAKKLGKETPGFFVPAEVQQRSAWLPHQVQQRATYQVGTAIQGGNLVQTSLLVDQFIDALRNQSRVMDCGAQILGGLVGNVDISRRTSTTNTYWVAESATITESEGTFDKVSLRPKTVGSLSRLSRNMLLQATPSIEMSIRSDMMMQLGLAIDLAALSGSGTGNQPTGIANTAGIGTVVGGTNGANLTMDYIVQLEAALANSNAPVADRQYIANTKSIATLKKQVASTGSYIWTTVGTGQRTATPPSINGYGIQASNQLRSTLTKGTSSGVCSELVFGAWSELLIGQWGVLEIMANPYDSTGFASGDVVMRAMQTMDIGIKHPGSFAFMSDALTP
jgi:HK97 family phage major capsid protein/HK97 family phage prohead protease